MKLVLSGTVGVGKSTLAAALGEHFDLPLIDEYFDDFFDLRRLAEKSADVWREEFLAIFRHKSALEDEHQQFVADRCAIDLLHYWCHRGLEHRLGRETNRAFFAACMQRIKAYDYVILLPWGGLALQQVEGDRQKKVGRNFNPFVRLKHHAAITGFAHVVMDKRRIIEVPVAVAELQQRLDFVCATIARREALIAGRGAS
ncbi:MAG: AAA family ATPase [Porticoccaceae bacterium]